MVCLSEFLSIYLFYLYSATIPHFREHFFFFFFHLIFLPFSSLHELEYLLEFISIPYFFLHIFIYFSFIFPPLFLLSSFNSYHFLSSLFFLSLLPFFSSSHGSFLSFSFSSFSSSFFSSFISFLFLSSLSLSLFIHFISLFFPSGLLFSSSFLSFPSLSIFFHFFVFFFPSLLILTAQLSLFALPNSFITPLFPLTALLHSSFLV